MIAALAAGASALVAVARAQPARDEAVRATLVVDAEPRCATRASVAAQVYARSGRIAFVDDSAGLPRIHVAIGGAAAGDRVAQLAVQWPDGRRSERTLRAASCVAAQEALALLVAMTLDPAAFERTSEPGGSEASGAGATQGERADTDDGASDTRATGQAATDDATAAATPPTPEAAATTEPVTSAQARETDGSADPSTDTRSAHPLGLAGVAAGARAQLVTGPASRAMPGLGVYARLALHGSGWWAPAVQLQLAHGWADGISGTGGVADFAIESAALDVCPLGLQRSPILAHACLTGTLGRLRASGADTYAPRTRHELWSSLGGRLLLTLGLASWAELQGGFGLVAPLQRYRFAFSPTVFHRVPGVCLEGHLGAGLRFP